ncbi:flagellar protein FlgN [Motiliproteus coralliicola]|uniref:Flagellar protein FlgN n=1 Tax=Motiliproteus coralliicola TaxID=2283196 RepID=A0A369WLP5_9GAMM|nr:flagellar protein FlgN [Motiliproteus coralliicola]RDE22381.1 flagellar protein FlgN [Motiliproteus coralliicola]
MKEKILLTRQFCELIDKGSQILAALCRLSEQEKTAIEQIDATALQSCVTEKQKQLELLAENTLQRNEALVGLGFSADDKGLEQLQASLPPAIANQVDSRWQRLRQSLEKAAELNQRNEQIVQRSQHNLGHLISILQGHSGRSTIYNDAGYKGNYSAQNRLGKA